MKKILIIEDDKFLLDTYAAGLKNLGYNVLTQRDGMRAFQITKEYMPDLIILDLVIPLKDGFSVLQELKAEAQTRDIPVIIASNLDQEDSVKRGLAMGASGYFVKSNISITELIDICTKYLA